MKNGKEFTEGNAFEPYGQEEPVRISLPELYGENTAEVPCKRYRTAFLIIIAVITAVICLLIFLLSDRGEAPLEVPLPSESAEEWRGAFADRSVYDGAMEASVGLRMGRVGQTRYWSGVVVTEDGWIATSSEAIGEADKGRIYVTLSDGREYAAESILKDGKAAAVKISATALTVPKALDRDIHSGQRMICVSGGAYVLSGEISSVTDDEISLNAAFEEVSEGAPVFDDDGFLMGIVTDGRLVKAVDIQAMIESMVK